MSKDPWSSAQRFYVERCTLHVLLWQGSEALSRGQQAQEHLYFCSAALRNAEQRVEGMWSKNVYRSIKIHVKICEASLYCSRVMFFGCFLMSSNVPHFSHFEDVHVAISNFKCWGIPPPRIMPMPFCLSGMCGSFGVAAHQVKIVNLWHVPFKKFWWWNKSPTTTVWMVYKTRK